MGQADFSFEAEEQGATRFDKRKSFQNGQAENGPGQIWQMVFLGFALHWILGMLFAPMSQRLLEIALVKHLTAPLVHRVVFHT